MAEWCLSLDVNMVSLQGTGLDKAELSMKTINDWKEMSHPQQKVLTLSMTSFCTNDLLLYICNPFHSLSVFLCVCFKIYYNREFVNQGYKTEKLFIALNKLAQDQSLHPLCNALSYILFLSFEITCNTIYI